MLWIQLAKWANGFQKSLGAIDRWKNPKNPESLTRSAKGMDGRPVEPISRINTITPGTNVNLPFPVLMDTDQKVSKGI